MRYAFVLVLIAAFALTACDQYLVGRSTQLTGGPSDAIFVISAPAIVNLSSQMSVVVSIDQYSQQVAGWEFELLYQDVNANVNAVNYLDFFPGTVPSTDYFCIGPDTSVSGVVSKLACAGITGTSDPADAPNDAYQILLTPTQVGTMRLNITNQILANSSGPPDYTGPIPVQASVEVIVEVCQDVDGDGFYNNLNPNCGPVDCNDGDLLTYPGATEICDLIDNDCNGPVDDGLTCTAFMPSVNSIVFGAQDLSINNIVQGSQLLTSGITDSSEATGNSDVISVEYFLGTTSLGTSSQQPDFPYLFDSTARADGPNTIQAVATDAVGFTGSLSLPIDINNNIICDVTSIDWNPTGSISEGSLVNIDATGASAECDGKQFTLVYEENDAGVYTVVTLLNMPGSITFTGTTATVIGNADWFKDNVNDGDFNPEIRVSLTDNMAQVEVSSDLLILNNPPTLQVTNTSDADTAQVIATTSGDLSLFVFDYGLDSGYGTTVTSGAGYLESFQFDLTGLTSSTTYFYRITATDEGEQLDIFTGSFETSRITADFTGPGGIPDGVVDLFDLLDIADRFRTAPGDEPLYNPLYDVAPVAGDNIINILDLTRVVLAFN